MQKIALRVTRKVQQKSRIKDSDPSTADPVAYDTILLRHGLADEDAILFAMEHQDQNGEPYVEHLCSTGQVNRSDFLDAIGKELDCRVIDLDAAEISPEATKLIGEEDARRLLIIPFAVDDSTQFLYVACPCAPDRSLADQIRGICPDLTPQLHFCLPDQLRRAIDSVYSPRAAEPVDQQTTEDPAPAEDDARSMLVVTSFPQADRLLCRALAEEGWTVFVMNSVTEASEVINSHAVKRILIRHEPDRDYSDFVRECVSLYPETAIRAYRRIGDIIGGGHRRGRRLLLDALGLVRQTALADIQAPPSSKAIELSSAIAERLDLTEQEQLVLDTCSHLYDLCDFFLGETPDAGDPRKPVRMIASGLESMNYSPDVVAGLRQLYGPIIDSQEAGRVAANILTLVDFCLERWPELPFIEETTFVSLSQTVSDQVGRLFLEDVVKVFLDIIGEHIVPAESSEGGYRVLVLCSPGQQARPDEALRNSAFEVMTRTTVHEFVQAYRQDQPDMLILVLPGTPELVSHRVSNLIARGIVYDQIPTLLLVEHTIMADLADLYHHGIEDICPIAGSQDLLRVKMERIRQRLETERDHRRKLTQGLGTHGSLADMNVIDLLQAMRSAEKTALISVTGLKAQLTVYITGGQLIYAESGGLIGAEAVFSAIGWRQGVWSIEPVRPEDIPPPNNSRSIDAILIEGCTLLDEKDQKERSSQVQACW